MAVFSGGQPRLLQAIRDNLWLLLLLQPRPYAPCQHQTIGQIKVTTGQCPAERLCQEQEVGRSSGHEGFPAKSRRQGDLQVMKGSQGSCSSEELRAGRVGQAPAPHSSCPSAVPTGCSTHSPWLSPSLSYDISFIPCSPSLPCLELWCLPQRKDSSFLLSLCCFFEYFSGFGQRWM